MNNEQEFRFRKIQSKPKAHPLVRKLVDIMNQQGIPVGEVCAEAGIARNTFTLWGKTQSPRVDTLDACGQVCGFKLAWVPIDDDAVYHNERRYLAKSPDGQQIRITNLKSFCRTHNLPVSSARKVLDGEYEQCRGWTFQRLDDSTAVEERRASLRKSDRNRA